ncbi:MAG: autotransporter outer membrane beta-barrel domain-containing protein, partial [Deltaproteobacteria bacterium]|nr:autotransporter outer membrane beta-barrel domain-containing protein [Deltaproteobacteria bacterium]
QGELNLNGTLKVSAPLQITGNPNLNGSVILDINETDAGALLFYDKANINNANLIIQIQEQDINITSEWEKTILTAPHLNQQFASYSDNSEIYDFLIDYHANHISLTVKDVNLLSLCAATNPSENIASLINKLEKGINTDSTNQLITKIYSLKENKKICQALQSLSPETIVSSVAGARANISSHLKNISARLNYYHISSQPQNKLAQLASDYFGFLNLNNPNKTENYLWIRQSYSKTNQDADNLHIGFDTSGLGISAGIDYLVGKLLLGISGGHSNSEIEYQDGYANGDITTYNISAYGSYAPNKDRKYYIDAILTYSGHTYDLNRRIMINTLAETAKSDWQASDYGAYITAGYKIPFKNNLTITPVISLQYSDYSQDSFVENGSIGDLETAEANYQSLIAGVGFTLEKQFNYKNWILQPYLSFIYERNFEDTVNNIQTRLLSMPANLQSITATGYDSGANNYTIGFGIQAYTQKNLQLHFNYDLIVRKNALSHQLGFGLKLYF